MPSTKVTIDVRDAVAWIMLDRPASRNAIDEQMALELAAAMECASGDPEVRVVVLGATGKIFCAGGDLGDKATGYDPDRMEQQRLTGLAFMENAITPMIRAIYHCPKPVIAAVHGHAVGAGIGLALAADIVLAARSAKFMPLFVPNVALIPDLGTTWTLSRAIGRPRATALMMLGDDIPADRAEAMGMIWRAIADEDFQREVATLALRLAAGPGFALSALKVVLDESWAHDFDQQVAREGEVSSRCVSKHDFAEAVDAFVGRRSPRFRSLAASDLAELQDPPIA